jgi:hypothetical protein
MAGKLATHEPAQTTLDHVNNLLVGATWAVGYAMGLVCALAWNEGKEPSPIALARLSRLVLDLPADVAKIGLHVARGQQHNTVSGAG